MNIHLCGKTDDDGMNSLRGFLDKVVLPFEDIVVWNYHGSGEYANKPEDVVPEAVLKGEKTLTLKLWCAPTPSFEEKPHENYYCGDPIQFGDRSFLANGSQGDGYAVWLKPDKIPLEDQLRIGDKTYAWKIKNTVFMAFDLLHYDSNIESFIDGVLVYFKILEKSVWAEVSANLFRDRLTRIMKNVLKRDREQIQQKIDQLSSNREQNIRDFMTRVQELTQQIEEAALQNAFFDLRNKKMEAELGGRVEEILKMKFLRDAQMERNQITLITSTAELMGMPLPQFQIKLDTQGHYSATPIPYAELVVHPHINENGGVCFGTQASQATSVVMDGDISGFLTMFARLLKTYSLSGGPYHRMEQVAKGLIRFWVRMGENDKADRCAAIWNYVYLKGSPVDISGKRTKIDRWDRNEVPSTGYVNNVGDGIGSETARKQVEEWETKNNVHVSDLVELV